MSRHKLKKFAAVAAAPNVLYKPENIQNNWHKVWFQNHNPITLELGCGRGEYTIALARIFPEKNFIGIDRKGDRLWAGARVALHDQLKNVVFLRIDIQNLLTYFGNNEVAEIWITFPDPLARGTKGRLRLTSERFLPLYQKILVKNGVVHLKTDHENLYRFTKNVLLQYDVKRLYDTADLYNEPIDDIALTIQTAFEKKHVELADTIKYLRFKFC